MADPAPALLAMEDLMLDLLRVAGRIPRQVRHTLAQRIVQLGLEATEYLFEATFSATKLPALQKANLSLDKTRLLLRIAHRAGFVDAKDYERLSVALVEVGKQVGGWKKAAMVRA